MKQLVRGTIVAVCVAGAAEAQNFSGPYLGIGVGHVRGDADGDFEADAGPPVGMLRLDDTVSFDGFELGAFGGVRGRLPGGIVIGMELGGNLGDVEGTESDILDLAGLVDVSGRLQRRGEVALSIRAGAEVAPGTLVYGILGAQAAAFEFRASGPLGLSISEDGIVPGWHYGLGVEQALSERISARFEYIEHEYDTFDTSAGPVDISVTPDERAFRLGLIWSF